MSCIAGESQKRLEAETDGASQHTAVNSLHWVTGCSSAGQEEDRGYPDGGWKWTPDAAVGHWQETGLGRRGGR